MQEVDLQWSKPSLTVLGVLSQSLGYRNEEIDLSFWVSAHLPVPPALFCELMLWG